MNEGTRNVFVGLFVLASLTVLGLLMVWFGETPSWLPSNEWVLRITDVRELSGVGEGSALRFNGVEIGRVSDLQFENPQRPAEGVVIIARIKREFSVPQDAFARVYGATFGFGAGHIDVIVEPGIPYVPLKKDGSAEIHGEMRSIVGEMISKDLVQSIERTIVHIGELAAAAAPVAKNLADLIEQREIRKTRGPDGATPNLSTVVERIDRLIANVNAVLGDENVQTDVKATVGELRQATIDLREMIGLWQRESLRISENANAGIDRVEESFQQSFGRLNDVLEALDNVATSMAVVMGDVAEGKGTAGLIARDERLYEAAVLALQRLSEMAATIQRIAGKIEEDGYITLGQVTPVGTWTKKFPLNARGTTAKGDSP